MGLLVAEKERTLDAMDLSVAFLFLISCGWQKGCLIGIKINLFDAVCFAV